MSVCLISEMFGKLKLGKVSFFFNLIYNTLSLFRCSTFGDKKRKTFFVRASTALRRSRNLTKTIFRFLPIGLLPIAHLLSDFYLSDICQSRLLPIRHFPIKTFAYFQVNKKNKTFAYQTFASHVSNPLCVTFANQ